MTNCSFNSIVTSDRIKKGVNIVMTALLYRDLAKRSMTTRGEL